MQNHITGLFGQKFVNQYSTENLTENDDLETKMIWAAQWKIFKIQIK